MGQYNYPRNERFLSKDGERDIVKKAKFGYNK